MPKTHNWEYVQNHGNAWHIANVFEDGRLARRARCGFVSDSNFLEGWNIVHRHELTADQRVCKSCQKQMSEREAAS